MVKAEEILDKHLELRSWVKIVPKNGNLYNTLLDVVNKALSVGQSEQLKAKVFALANELALVGEGDAAVAMHRMHNRL